VATYDYTDAAGKLLYQAVRFQPKDFRQRRPDPDKAGEWLWNLKGVPATLFKLPDLLAAITAGRSVFIVEGEKDVLSLTGIGLAATCNSGGAGKFPTSMASIFTGANVKILPDNDAPGQKHGQDVAKKLKKYAASVKVVAMPSGKDVSDWIAAGGTRDQLIALVKAAPEWTPETAPAPEPEPPKVTAYHDPKEYPFRFLGYNDNHYYYLPGEDLQIIALSPDQHTQASLISIAPLQWWETMFPNKQGCDWNAARNWLFRASKKEGIYDVRRLRGCGTWFDEGRVVQHNGDRLVVDGVPLPIVDLKTRYIYNASFPLDVTNARPLTKGESHRYLELCRMPSWEKPINGTLLAGWCVVAPICGALSWRPHIWITGAAGTGKTWIVENMVKPIVGKIALQAQGSTSEAAIRQSLGINAVPVITDEMEGENTEARRRLQAILELVRQSSSETGAPIIKGGQSGHAVVFMPRSCFSLSSIGVNITQRADSSRVSVLSLVRPTLGDVTVFFNALKAEVAEVINPTWCASLRARTLTLIPVILENARTFAHAAAEKFQDQRIGDQLGALLAGAYSLTSDTTIQLDDARAWIDSRDWSDQASIEDETDEVRCIRRICEHMITYTSDRDRVERTVGEILTSDMFISTATEAIERIGIRRVQDQVLISDSHSGIAKILRETPWEKTWGRILKRLPGAEAKPSIRFNGTCHRATQLPYKSIFVEEKP
jgi:putative DNA primase/helicase